MSAEPAVSMANEAAPHRAYVYAACTALAVAVNYAFGKEMAWDLLHYHFYAGFSALNDRFTQDYFAAGTTSYLNPYAYVPFYVLVKLGLPGLAVGTVMAMIHSVVLWLTYELACRVSPLQDRKGRFFFGLCATVLAFMNPILLQQIGSSFSDVTTTVLVLGGWLLLVQAVQRPRTTLVVFAAILLGIATALKLTNGLYAVGAFFLVIFLPLPRCQDESCNLFYFGATLGNQFHNHHRAVVLSAGANVRKSAVPLAEQRIQIALIFRRRPQKHYRFIPDSLTDALLRPFSMAGTDFMIDDEMPAPNICYVLLLTVFLISVIAWIWRSSTLSPIPPGIHQRPDRRLALLQLLGSGFTFGWIVWLNNSGNSRYFLPMATVAAVIAVALLFRLLANHTFGRNGILLALSSPRNSACSWNRFTWRRIPLESGALGWAVVRCADSGEACSPTESISIDRRSIRFLYCSLLGQRIGLRQFCRRVRPRPQRRNCIARSCHDKAQRAAPARSG